MTFVECEERPTRELEISTKRGEELDVDADADARVARVARVARPGDAGVGAGAVSASNEGTKPLIVRTTPSLARDR